MKWEIIKINNRVTLCAETPSQSQLPAKFSDNKSCGSGDVDFFILSHDLSLVLIGIVLVEI